MNATLKDIERINSLYQGRRAFFGDLHLSADSFAYAKSRRIIMFRHFANMDF